MRGCSSRADLARRRVLSRALSLANRQFLEPACLVKALRFHLSERSNSSQPIGCSASSDVGCVESMPKSPTDPSSEMSSAHVLESLCSAKVAAERNVHRARSRSDPPPTQHNHSKGVVRRARAVSESESTVSLDSYLAVANASGQFRPAVMIRELVRELLLYTIRWLDQSCSRRQSQWPHLEPPCARAPDLESRRQIVGRCDGVAASDLKSSVSNGRLTGCARCRARKLKLRMVNERDRSIVPAGETMFNKGGLTTLERA